MNTTQGGTRDLRRYAWLSVAAALATITLKVGAWWMTGSVGLLSDAAESLVNLAAAIVAVYALGVAARPADQTHLFGHAKAEYFSAAAEGQMIVLAALVIVWTAVERLLHPAALENVGWGLAVSIVASVINGSVAMVLLRAGRRERSLALTADGTHLLTDVWTSIGVVLGVLLVALTGWLWLDPVIALAVGVNIIFAGYKLMRSSIDGLMDHAWPAEDSDKLLAMLQAETTDEVSFHGVRTRRAGHANFADVHVLVPGAWSVQDAHDVVDALETRVANELPGAMLTTHLEPREDPKSYDDYDAEAITSQ